MTAKNKGNAASLARKIAARRAEFLPMAVAESCTGGLLAAALSAVPGASAWFAGGVVAYANDVKIAALGVPKNLLQLGGAGAVSEETARAMCQGALSACALNDAQCRAAISITGIAGPKSDDTQKTVGTVCFGIHTPRAGLTAQTVHFQGNRTAIRRQAVIFALQEFLRRI